MSGRAGVFRVSFGLAAVGQCLARRHAAATAAGEVHWSACVDGSLNALLNALLVQVAAGSLVLKPVPPGTMVAGSPAKEVGHVTGAHQPLKEGLAGVLVRPQFGGAGSGRDLPAVPARMRWIGWLDLGLGLG